MTRNERILKLMRERLPYFQNYDDGEFLSIAHFNFREIYDHIRLKVDHEMLEERVKTLEEAEHGT